MRRSIILSSFLFFFGFPLWGSEPLFLSVRTQIFPSTTVPFAEPFQILSTIDSNQPIFLSTFSIPDIEGLEILKNIETSSSQETPEKKFKSEIKLTLLPLAVGEILFPTLSIPYSAQKVSSILQTPPIKILVAGSIGENVSPEMLKDIKPPIQLSFWNWIWTTITISLLIFTAFWFLIKRRRGNITRLTPPTPARPADEVALENLERILEEYRRSGAVKTFCVALSNLLRDYLGCCYGIDAMEKTTSEIFSAMKTEEIDRKICLHLKEILTDCDLVKFAKFSPSEKELMENFEKCKRFILTTKPVLPNNERISSPLIGEN